MKIVVIGTGGIAHKAYFPLLAVMPEVEIVSVHSRTQERVDAACRRWNLPNGTTELSDILSIKPDAVLVISSTESHYDICRLMLENGIDVYAEKSLTTSSALSYDLAKIAKKNDRILMVGFNRRYALLYKQAREILGDQSVELAVIQKHRTYASYTNLFDQYLVDTIHQIDLMRFFCGDVEAATSIYNKGKDLITSAISTTTIPGGGQGVILVSNNAGAWQESATIHAAGLSIHVDAFQRMRVIRDDHEEIYGTDRAGKWITSTKERGFFGEMEHFFECVHTRIEPFTNAVEAAKTQELLEGMVLASGDEIND